MKNLFNKELVFLDIESPNANELFKIIADELQNKGFVNEKYHDGLINREKDFPTGLQLEDYSVSIPHTDPETVKKDFIAIVRPRSPIMFSLMEDNDKKTPVDLCFFIGLRDGKKSPLALMELISLIQNHKLILSILNEKNREKIIEKIQEVRFT
ncbi:PTS sugar transporter subunit IIA [Tetragenococcus halophilus]|uniref:Arabitol-specific phosphotransferase system enzyme IIA component n=1 Tax=Tetragenococcus halophilus (strain DSM 20338 / JCM 20259 / NCIMB 9735 / NBRC 12172) TaxID=945021 RepID=A0AAN1SHN4_TETHN|nr:PTS sugar transporter subunit IIA [Tetragenococcus halophilus]BAK95213.1 putative arabitol-specific phosphotransferase system enzyme IIA component [Tetragenococcus halophilus NBRC 12172]GBD70197.1 putative arabitol-specific phosphotransferase system enzyme IIA component [Tetragenococcus halophilus subsp. halophilus]